ncbi:MAG: branched-chain amino acid ABC transporter permease, partial [Chloroflexota bacterium]
GFTFYANPRTVLNVLPLVMALAAGTSIAPLAAPWLARAPLSINARRIMLVAFALIGLGMLALGMADFPLSKLIAQSATATGGAVVTAAAQESDGALMQRIVVMVTAGFVLGLVRPQRTKAQPLRPLITPFVLLVVAVAVVVTRIALEQLILSLATDARFVLALVIGALTGAGVGALLEFGLIRPLYSRPIYQVLLTLGLVFVGDQFIKFVWGPSGFFMEIPSLFNGQGKECPSDNVLAWFGDHCASIMIMGRGFPSYRIFIILLGAAMLLALALLLQRTRLGLIIRAGVQDAEMVEALGINVRRVFTSVFALGAGLAALGGVAAAPIIGVNPGIGQEFLLQGFIAVVIGGMGSLAGAAAGSLLVGLGRAFGDYLVLSGVQLPWMAQAITASPAIARASTVLIMALVLLLKPSGIFGKRE